MQRDRTPRPCSTGRRARRGLWTRSSGAIGNWQAGRDEADKFKRTREENEAANIGTMLVRPAAAMPPRQPRPPPAQAVRRAGRRASRFKQDGNREQVASHGL